MGGQVLRFSKSKRGTGGLWPTLLISATVLGPACYVIGEFTEYCGPFCQSI